MIEDEKEDTNLDSDSDSDSDSDFEFDLDDELYQELDSEFGEEPPLQTIRLDTVERCILKHQPASVLDLGCGQGGLLARLIKYPQIKRIAGVDISEKELRDAKSALLGERSHETEAQNSRIRLLQGSFTEPNEELKGFDLATLIETIEHIPAHQLSALEHAVFGHYQPKVVLLSTPNQEYNSILGVPPYRFRHPGHFFEWTRAKFESWANGVAKRNKYEVEFINIGPFDLLHGSPTQMAQFMKRT